MRLEVTLDPNKPEEITAVVMHNVSDGGFAFWFRRSLPGRTIIYVRESDGETFGEWLPTLVRHCTRGLLGFLVGAQFDWEDEEASPASAPGATSRSAPRIVDTKAEHLRRLVRRQFAAKRP
jgi:hypothetical protein